MKIRDILIILFLTEILFLGTRAYATNGMFPIFMGSQAAGRGGTDFGIASDPTCINTNPAGIAFLRGKMLDFTMSSFFPSITYSGQYDNNSHANFEPVPFASFSMVWDSSEQTFEIFGDPWSYVFGGRPLQTDYAYFSKGEPITAEEYSRNEGPSFWEFSATKIPGELILEAQGKGASISDIKVYGYTSSSIQEQVFFTTDSLPSLPVHSEITTISVSFQYYCEKQSSQPSRLILDAEEVREIFDLQNTSGVWNNGYFALVWKKKVPPVCITLLAPPSGTPFQIRSIRISLGYRIADVYYWKDLYASSETVEVFKNTNYPILFSDSATYNLEFGKPLQISLSPIKSTPENLTKIKVMYYYRMDIEVPERFLHVSLKNGQQTLNAQEHLKAYRESPKVISVCRRQADYEQSEPDRESGFKFGFGIFPQAGARYSITLKADPLFPDGIENRTDLIFASVAPTIAYRFKNRFSIGVSLNLNLEMIELDGLIMQDSRILKGPLIVGKSRTYGEALIDVTNTYNVRGEVDTDYLYGGGIGGRVGFLWRPTDNVQIGAVYVPQTWMMDAMGEAKVDFTKHFEDPSVVTVSTLAKAILLPNHGIYGIINHYDAELEFNLPQRVGTGFSWLICDNFMFAADFQWINYSHTQKKLKAKLKNGNSEDFNALAGSEDVIAIFNLGWKDQYVVSAGIVWQPSPIWILRAGYNYGSNPVPEKYLNPQLAAIAEHHVTVGCSYVVNRNLTLNAAVECALPSKLNSGSVNYAHEGYVNSELEFFSIDAVVGMDLRF